MRPGFIICLILALFLQLYICFKAEEGFLKILPLFMDITAFIYAGARFWGLISFVNFSRGIYDGGISAGILISIDALGGLIGVVLAWTVYYLVKLYNHKETNRK